MYNIFVLGLATLVVIINGLLGHFFAPSGIMLTPIVLPLTTLLVCFAKKMNIILTSVLVYAFIALNDFFIKLYAGGSHDEEGLGWIHGFLFLGLVPAFGILVFTTIKRKDEILAIRVLAVVLFAALIGVHLSIFSHLGLGRYYWYNWNN